MMIFGAFCQSIVSRQHRLKPCMGITDAIAHGISWWRSPKCLESPKLLYLDRLECKAFHTCVVNWKRHDNRHIKSYWFWMGQTPAIVSGLALPSMCSETSRQTGLWGCNCFPQRLCYNGALNSIRNCMTSWSCASLLQVFVCPMLDAESKGLLYPCVIFIDI